MKQFASLDLSQAAAGEPAAAGLTDDHYPGDQTRQQADIQSVSVTDRPTRCFDPTPHQPEPQPPVHQPVVTVSGDPGLPRPGGPASTNAVLAAQPRLQVGQNMQTVI